MNFIRRIDWVDVTMMTLACSWVAVCSWYVTSAFVNYLSR